MNWRWIALVVACFGLCGCYTKRVVWSSDGGVAAVRGEDGLYLANGDGEVSERWLEAECLFDWVPGTRRLVVAEVEEVSSWEGLAGRLDEKVRGQVENEAEGLMVWLESGGPWVEAGERAGELRMRGAAVLLCVSGKFGDRLAALGHGDDDGESEVAVTRLIELTTEGLKVVGRRVVADGLLGSVADVNCSPNGEAVAVTLMNDESEASSLVVAGLEGTGRAFEVDENDVAFYPDWTPDGRALVYEKSVGGRAGGDEMGLGVLLRRGVVGEAGGIEISAESEELAGGLFGFYSKVRCLPDGGILFTGMPARLPAVVRDLPQRHELFLLEPGRRATLARVLPEAALVQLPENLAFFELSPDGKRLVVPGEEGQVFIVGWEAGDVGVISDEEMGSLKSVPVWRTAEELCYVGVVGEGDDTGEEVVLWKDNEERVVSGGWGEKVREGWLE